MEKNIAPDSNPSEPPPSLGEAMSNLLKSMDPQGLLNMADQEDEAGDHDATKGGDVHAGTHAVSLSHEGSSEAGSGSKSSEETADPGEDQNKMDVETPRFRIVDIEAPAASATTTFSLNASPADGSARPVLDPVPLAVLPATPLVQPSGFDFAVPTVPLPGSVAIL